MTVAGVAGLASLQGCASAIASGAVARSNDFAGMGTDNTGRRIAFGAKSTDFSFMSGEYFAGRQSRRGTFGHI